jgi:outer membrane murein-binding lipoprotein Lpp
MEARIVMAISQEIVDLDTKVDALAARVAAIAPAGLSAEDKAAVVAIGAKVDGIAQAPAAPTA